MAHCTCELGLVGLQAAREHGCHFGHSCSRAVLVTRATAVVLQVENSYNFIINNGPSRRPVFTGVQK